MDFARYAITRPVNIWILVLICLLGGTLAFFEIGRLEDPEFTIKQAIVNVQYPGATALEVEQQVTEPLESAIQQMSQIKEIRSRSMPGIAEIRVEIQDRYDGDALPQIWDELRNKINDAQGDLPPGIEPPQVNDDFGDVYGIFYALTGDGLTLKELHETAKDLRRALVAADGVGKVEIAGVQEERILVEVDQAQLAAMNIAPDEIAAALGDTDAAVEAGGVNAGDFFVRLRPSGAFDSLEELRALSVGQGPQRVELGAIAKLSRDYAERPQQIIRHNGQPALTLGISGVSGANIVEVGHSVEAVLQANEHRMPLGAELHALYEQHRIVDESVNSFALNVFLSVAIVVGVLCIAMGLRAGVIIGAVLFLTVLGTLLVMWLAGIELERISLGALIIAMGMLVDNAVVVCDGMLVRQRQGKSILEASQQTLQQTQWPLLGATIIGILAFAGIGLSQDTTGEFLFSLFFVIAVSLLLSWLLALLLVPLFGHYLLRNAGADEDADAAYDGPWYARYRRLATGVLRRPKLTIGALLVLTVISAVIFTRLPQSFFPPSSTPLFYVNLFLPQGTHIRDTARAASEVEQYLAEQDGVSDLSSFIGAGASRFMLTYMPEQPNASLMHFLVRTEDAERIDGLVRQINQELPQRYPSADVSAAQFMFGPNAEAKLEARISGPDIQVLREISAEGRKRLQEQGQVLNVRDDWRQPVLVLRPQLALDRLADAGLTRQAVARALAAGSEGQRVSLLRERDELIPVLLRAAPDDRIDADNLLQRLIWSPAGNGYVPLAQVADRIEPSSEDGIIVRYDRERTISIRAEPRDGENTNEAHERIRPLIEGIELPVNYSLKWGGDYEQSSDAQQALASTLAVPYLAMVLVTVLLFARVRQPLMIWAVVPMAICGVSFGLLLTGQAFGFMALLGLLSLTGMLIKNAVVLVDEIDRQIAAEVPRLTAIIEASASRLRPVTMAAGTTVLGMVPLLFDPFFANMAVTIMGGLGFATLLTLLAVPCLYLLLMKVRPEETA
ncbi:MAG: multidrug transporter AcrB [Pseudomonadales bacterium RIFCSPHIGHO2_01_FULL_64_12]|uniref:Efflux RND transporter permease subunit n=1 Tax=Stutzerimonas stutzeri TaxID=316 RepID=A0AA42PB19_STUST|nr:MULTISPECIES: efflux RND transporter permease subunit [Stutzerimonas]OHC16912.1 MAG: multidrug transporter AcrB [Pseudomonadales bacterium RIFCSPHIGHO2_01_FULL_64_12]MDH0102658.1 efflux RND transporter permease subunit [Stutzerimonas stutzeri]MDH0689143.1 efflux RND transporter permease subunit [Stutzerimonas stutzeri]MDH1236780.1 efflux RND transporter permease subunit [Stutzerimonas stutzeri]MDL2172957.1 efflux RND transporter permease subunit [Stutzerimonas sp. FeSN7]